MSQTLLTDPPATLQNADTSSANPPAVPPVATGNPPATPPAPAAPVIPEKYDLKLPENGHVTAADLEGISKLAKELGVSKNELAQKLVDDRNGALAGFKQAQQTAHNERVRTWEDEVRNDSQIGGAQYDATINHAKAALARFDTTGDMRKMLTDSGYGSNPTVVKLFAAIGKAISEDKFVSGGAASRGPVDPAQQLYGPK